MLVGVGSNVDAGVGSTANEGEDVGVPDPLQPVIARLINAVHRGKTVRLSLLKMVLGSLLSTYPPYPATSVMVS